MVYTIKVDVLMTDSESSSVQETTNRTLRLLPSGEYGIAYKRGIYQLHDLNGSSGHIHPNDSLPYEYEECPVFEGQLLVSGLSVVHGAIDFSGKLSYLVVSCVDDVLFEILEDLLDANISWIAFGPSIRNAENGQRYDHWIRLETKSSKLGNSRTERVALVEALVLKDKIDHFKQGSYRLLIDDVITSKAKNAPKRPRRKISKTTPKVTDAPKDEIANDLLMLSNTTDRLLRGLRESGWSDHDLSTLSERMQKHGKEVVRQGDSDDADWRDKVATERAVMIGDWSKDRLKAIHSETKATIDELNDQITILKHKNSDLNTQNELLSAQGHSNSEAECNHENIIIRLQNENEEWLEDHEKLLRQVDLARQEAEDLKMSPPARNIGRPETAEYVIETLLNNIRFVITPPSFIYELEDPTRVLNDLMQLNTESKLDNSKKIVGVSKWFEKQFNTGKNNLGRLYYKINNDEVRVALDKKNNRQSQKLFIKRLAHH
jgi:hypothetical protein